jgi:hypothetical protein
MQTIARWDDARYQTQPVTSWEVIDKPAPFGDPLNKLRLQVTYADGKVKILAPSFKDRSGLDIYVARFHLNFAGKERVNVSM